MINGHGNNITDIKYRIVSDFSTNVYANPQTNNILEHLRSNLDSICNYPDCNCSALRNKIANHFQINSKNILVTNGSTEAFYLLAHVFEKSNSVIPIPSFAEYQDACNVYKHRIEFVSTQTQLQNTALENKLVWIGNPNNPDGKYYNRHSLYSLLEKHPNTYFIIDEAYIDLCKEGESVASAVKDYQNLIVIKSFTKRFAVPGIRLGYVIANKDIIDRMLQYHMPWAVNSLALITGEYIVDHYAHEKPNTEKLLEESTFLQEQISILDNFEVTPTPCNYFLVRIKSGSAANLKEFLIEKHGFLIRDAANFKGLNPSWFRIAAQERENNIKLVNALKAWAEKNER